MNPELIKKMCCPACKGELRWNIKNQNENKIIEAEVKCINCKNYYSVKDEIGNFIIADNEGFLEEDNFKNQRNILKNIDKSIINKLIDMKKENLNASDISYLADIYREQNKMRSVLKLKILERSRKYNSSYNNSVKEQFDFLINHFDENNKIILDIATGRGTLLKYMLQYTNNNFVGSDISIIALNDLKKELISLKYYNRVSLIGFNSKKIPFLDKQFDIAMSFYAIGHVHNIRAFVQEIMRVCKCKFISIENLYENDNSVNSKYMICHNLEDHFKENMIKIISEERFDFQILNQKQVIIEATERGNIIPMTINSFPIETCHVKNCCIIIKGNKQ